MRAASDFSGARILSRDSRLGCGIEWLSKAWRNRKVVAAGRGPAAERQRDGEFQRIDFSGSSFGKDVPDYPSGCINRNAANRTPLTRLHLTEMKWLATKLTLHRSG